MCGIVGIYYFDSTKKVETADLKSMADSIVHRGPDDEGFFASRNVGLGMRRLSIIDLGGGHQPIFNEDRSKTIVFNGEIYNFSDHRHELEQKGYKFRTRTDTEVILYLYQEYGLDFFEKLNGMFGFAIWDSNERRLIIARDRLGIKPLYYFSDSEKVVFASEIKAILALKSVRAELDMEGFSTFLKYGFSPAPFTIFKNIHKIPPGHFLTMKGNDVVIKSFWNLSYAEKFEADEDKIGDKIYDLLKESVRYRMIADVPLGAFLSGGIDSSGIVHTMSDLNRKSINTYSIGFGKGFDFYNELDNAGRFAQAYETNHHEILVEPDVVGLFPKLIAHLDEPIGDSSFIVTYLVSKLARETVTVILSGVGGDELFGGYRRYLNIQINKYMRIIPVWLRRHVIQKSLNMVPVDRNNHVLNYFRLARAYFNTTSLMPQQQYGVYTSVFNDDFRNEITVETKEIPDFCEKYFEECDSTDLLDKIMYFDLKTSLPEQLLMLTDKMSMATSLEARVPFLDHNMVEFAAKIPSKLKINGFKLRYIQKKVFEERLPGFVFEQKKKGFGAPVGSWIRNELKEMVQDLLSEPRIRRQGIFNNVTIQRILDNHFKMKQDYTDNLLALIAFQIWHEEYL